MKVFNLGWVTHGRENASCIMCLLGHIDQLLIKWSCYIGPKKHVYIKLYVFIEIYHGGPER